MLRPYVMTPSIYTYKQSQSEETITIFSPFGYVL
jgi:hypothetical protein